MTVKPTAGLTLPEQIEVLEHETGTKKKLISERERWLGDPVNKMKSTYMAIVADTALHEDELHVMEEKLAGLKAVNIN